MQKKVGICQWFRYKDHEQVRHIRELLLELGVRHLRMNISCVDYYRSQGQQWYAWLLNELTPFELLPCLRYASPSFPGGNERVVATNGVPKLKDLERFAQFLLEILEQYSDRFDYIELWNEPDNRVNGAYRNGSNQGVSMQMLIEGVSAATMYGKKIVLGGMNLTDPLASHPWIMDSDILESLDVITARVFPGAWNDPDNTWCGWPTTLLGLKPHVFDYKIWITETGCATPTENHEEVQVQQLWDVVSGTAGAERVYWYTLLDLPNMYDDLRSSIGGHRESPCSFGLVAPDGRHKPAFDAMKELLHS